MLKLLDLFSVVIEYGKYVRTNALDGLLYWNKIKDFVNAQNPSGIDNKIGPGWNLNLLIDGIQINNKEVIYNYVHDTLNMRGEEDDSKEDKNYWDQCHFFLQLIRIPKNNSLTLLKLLQVAYNLGQLSITLRTNPTLFNSKVLTYFDSNRLENIETYSTVPEIDQADEVILNNIYVMVQKTIQIFCADIKQITLQNNSDTTVLCTVKNQQHILRNIKPGHSIPKETQSTIDKFLRVEEGNGIVKIDGIDYQMNNGIGIFIPAGKEHEIINNGVVNLKLYAIHSPLEQTETNKKYLKYKLKYLKLKN